MKKLLKDGFLMSRADRLAVANDLLESLEEWAHKGPKHTVTYKPVKELLKKDLDKLIDKKNKEGKNLPANEIDCINELCAIGLSNKKFKGDNLVKPKRKQPRDEKILTEGIDIEDHEYLAACNYWEDPEQLIIDLMDNKIARCKERFVKEWRMKLMQDPSVSEIPSEDDDLIELVVLRPDYKNRVQREAEVS